MTATTTESYSGFGRDIVLDNTRDRLLTPFAKATLTDRYLWVGESYQRMFARVACVNSDDNAHAQRVYDYISQLWFMPSTPILSNAGHPKNLTISCFLNEMGDSLEEIFETQNENNWLASRGGGIGTCYTPLRSIGEKVGEDKDTETSGIIPFIKQQDSATLAISQGGKRRGSAAAYLNIGHPEIEEFLAIRDIKGDPNRKSLNMHHGVVVPDAFMEALKEGRQWELRSPFDQAVISTVDARALWRKILEQRLKTGEPYIWFEGNVNRQAPKNYQRCHLKNTTSNLCSEITLTTGIDYNGRRRTAVCCLSSVNLETYNAWADNEQFVEDILRFLDNNMTNFLKTTNGVKGFERASYSAYMERSVGLGVMGFHGFLQARMIPFEGVMAKVWNVKIHKWLKEVADVVNMKLGDERGPCPDSVRAKTGLRFTHMFAIAPTASISIICGEASPCEEPNLTNFYKQKTLTGWFNVKNKWLDALLKCKAIEMHNIGEDAKEAAWVAAQWEKIIADNGSVQKLDCLNELEKETFKTAFEIKQEWLIEHAADRQPFICQGQSVNLFLLPTIHKATLNKLHTDAYKKGLKGLYYVRSKSIKQATNVAGEMPQATEQPKVHYEIDDNEPDECLSCQ